MKKDMPAWTLRDVLHAGGLPPMETRTDVVDLFKPPTLRDTALVGRNSVFEFQTDGKDLPMSLPMDVRRVLLRAIKRDVANGLWRLAMASPNNDSNKSVTFNEVHQG